MISEFQIYVLETLPDNTFSSSLSLSLSDTLFKHVANQILNSHVILNFKI